MNRIEIINKTIKKLDLKNYLEIGVYKGECFLEIACKNKTAVDPHFLIEKKRKYGHFLFDRKNLNNHYYEMLSDDFFAKYESQKNALLFDICFIDGLHTYEQSTKDVLNTLRCLRTGGYIFMHDCSPPNRASAVELKAFEDGSAASIEGWTGEWCGDVWKTIVLSKRIFPDFEIHVFDCDYGVGVIKKNTDRNLKFEDIQEDFLAVSNMTYDDLLHNRETMLGLVNPEAFHTIIH